MFSKGFVHDVLKLFISCFYAEKNLGKMPGDVLDGKKTCLSKTMKTGHQSHPAAKLDIP